MNARTTLELIADLERLAGQPAVTIGYLLYGHGRCDEVANSDRLPQAVQTAITLGVASTHDIPFTEVLDAMGATAEARRLRESIDAVRHAWMAAAHDTYRRTQDKWAPHLVLAVRRDPGMDPASLQRLATAAGHHMRIWDGWDGAA